MRNFVKSLLAVLSGAAIYYVLLPHLPPAARHHIFRVDLGLFLYSCICLAMWGGINWLDRK